MKDRLSDLRMVDPVLTNIAIGYKNSAFISETLFPVVTVDKESVRVPKFGKESFRLWATDRAPRATSNEMTPDKAGLIEVMLHEHDMGYPLDRREVAESMFDEQSKAAKRAKDAIELQREVTAATLAQNPSIYDATAKTVIAPASAWTFDAGDPLKIVEDGKEAMRNRIGLRPNTMVMGPDVYKILKYSKALQAQLGANEKKVITLDILRDLFSIKTIVIGEAVYSTDKKDSTGNIWGKNILMAYVAESDSDQESPSYGYTFRRRGYPQVDTYNKEGGKIQVCRYTDIYNVTVIGADAGHLIQDCVK